MTSERNLGSPNSSSNYPAYEAASLSGIARWKIQELLYLRVNPKGGWLEKSCCWCTEPRIVSSQSASRWRSLGWETFWRNSYYWPAYNQYWCWIYLQTTYIVETWESTNWGKDQDSCEPVARYRKTIECPKPEFTISDASLPRNANEAAKSWHFVDLDVIYPFQELTMQNLLFRQQVAKICTFKIDRFCPLLNSQSKT